ncbi:MAG TPA: DUF917 domain-containing protein [Pseudonocardia sp.]
MTLLGADDVDAFVVGMGLLGSGGGGDPAIFAPTLRRALARTPLTLVDPDDLGEAPVVAVGMLGGTRVLTEKLPSGAEIQHAVAALTRWTGVTPHALMPYEAAGVNGALAVATACSTGLPLVDADLMGRAFPRLDLLTRAADGGPLTPYALAEPGGGTMLVDDVDAITLERVARAFVAQGGGWAGGALAPVPASTVARDSCLGTMARALRLGRAHAELPPKPTSAQVADALGGRVLAEGRTVEIARQASATFGRAGIAVVDDGGPVLRVEAENEYLLALLDGEPVASCPDLLCVLDRRTAAPIAVDALRVGDDVTVVVLAGPPWWGSTPERRAYAGPRAFGLECDPVTP